MFLNFMTRRSNFQKTYISVLIQYLLLLTFCACVVEARSSPEQVVLGQGSPYVRAPGSAKKTFYKTGDAIPVSCLNRTL